MASGPFPFAGPATFVTADNPRGVVVSDEENAARRAVLALWLDGAGLVGHPAMGGAPGGDHPEPGVIVLGLDLPAAAELGARFEQAAVYVWEPDALHLIACAGPRHDILGYRATPGTSLAAPAALQGRLGPTLPQASGNRAGDVRRTSIGDP